VNKLEETQGERECLWGYAPMRTKPTPKEKPEALQGIHMEASIMASTTHLDND
jgi:hypothetical protein